MDLRYRMYKLRKQVPFGDRTEKRRNSKMEISKKAGKVIVALIISAAMVFTMMPQGMGGHAKAASKSATYKLEVSQSKCVVVAYKKVGGKWKYVRTMLCSTGTGGRTPNGTFHLGGKQRWGVLMGPVYGQYCCNITSSILFHSVWYNTINKANQSAREFNKLGSPASHGCVRLATIDAKWVYDKCKSGTLVRIGYGIKVPKGRPAKIYSNSGWDPTDPDPSNPSFKLKKAKIKAKSKKLKMGRTYKVKKMAKAYNPNALENISNKLKAKVKKNGKWKKITKIPTRRDGIVKVKYEVDYGYCRSNSKVVKYKVVDRSKPEIKADDREVSIGDRNAVKGVKAVQKGGTDVTKDIEVDIQLPDGTQVAEGMSYKRAKKFVFEKEGDYTVTYRAANKDYPSRKSIRTVTIAVIDDLAPILKAADRDVELGSVNAVKGVRAKQEGGRNRTKAIKVTIVDPNGDKVAKRIKYKEAKKFVFDQVGKYHVTYKVSNKNFKDRVSEKEVVIEVFDPENTNDSKKDEPVEPTADESNDMPADQNISSEI